MARSKSAFAQRTILYAEIYKEKPPQTTIVRSGMASPARFERAAFRLGGERSILLSYGDRIPKGKSTLQAAGLFLYAPPAQPNPGLTKVYYTMFNR